jgi:antitoxin (DNA-binding transcriptional repressor) of toxin-antitoxin stability system
MSNVNIHNAKVYLEQIIAGLKPGEEITISQDGLPIATLHRSTRSSWPCKAGSAKNTTFWMAPDFDAPLDEFREYME